MLHVSRQVLAVAGKWLDACRYYNVNNQWGTTLCGWTPLEAVRLCAQPPQRERMCRGATMPRADIRVGGHATTNLPMPSRAGGKRVISTTAGAPHFAPLRCCRTGTGTCNGNEGGACAQ